MNTLDRSILESMAELTVTDMFCGAGGSSTGALEVPGVTVKTAMNHWARAIETHNTNHPDTDHVLADIQVTDPRYIASSDILWASPECTNHSVAKGRKRISNQPDLFGESLADEAAEKSRATMWDVPRFAEQHAYKLIITENVVDAAKWVMFDAWLFAMEALGYDHHIVYMNSMHAQLGGLPAPQSRDRMYVMFWLKGNPKPDFDMLMPLAHCPTCDETVRCIQSWKNPAYRWGRYKAQYAYRCPNTRCKNAIIEPGWLPAAAAIDWDLRGQRIGDRKKPLVEKTMARIRAGLEKYGKHPVSIDAVRGSQIIAPVNAEPFPTQTTSYTRSLLVPVEGREGKVAQPVEDVMRTQTTRNETGFLMPPSPAATSSLLMEYYGNGVMHPTSKAIPTISTTDRFAMITTMRGTAPEQIQGSAAPVSDPLRTISAGGNHAGLTEWTVPEVEDCEFRMLEPYEITAGMAFPKSYIMTGNKREQVKQAGNAVTPPAARDLFIVAALSLASRSVAV
ncbi:DNA cytosine methyltransferase [Paeniglutamicibacter gangotriensis]|uniref:DNA (cytosine-5-)-methyltransferase n=1 Tax=Paeniglutamicibacter gangotriensis Lz1y TaxID=1276920 RepID=M7MTW7_9MICC|nr:DNA cytosine methyltransferase [Paeniglutamicibacter gangotriensis]EMQ98375.1 C-5 cytosine-specific DNA methylase [Paeniglutamicibacter gangotriensis Lz1y]